MIIKTPLLLLLILDSDRSSDQATIVKIKTNQSAIQVF